MRLCFTLFKMFAVRRIVRSNVNLKNHIYTSGVLKCDKPKDPKSVENKSNKEKLKEEKIKLGNSNEKKRKLTAEVNANDYAKFKSKNEQFKVELYSDTTTHEEKLKAKKKLETLAKEIENEAVADSPRNEKFKTLVVPKPKPKPKKIISGSKLEESAKTVAQEFGGDVKKTEIDILKYLREWEIKAEKRKLNRDVMDKEKEKEMIRKFKEDEQHIREGSWRGQRGGIVEGYGGREPRIEHVIMHGRESGAQPLGIFKLSDFKDEDVAPKLKKWDELEELELKASARILPRNYFEELIQWTEDGKLWHFPIDNDQGNELEENVDFTEHVFLEEHLEPWCPKRGPLRHFMELVLTGLSKNPYITAEEKRQTIFWYRDYFEQKKKLLQEMGALDSPKLTAESVKLNSKSE